MAHPKRLTKWPTFKIRNLKKMKEKKRKMKFEHKTADSVIKKFLCGALIALSYNSECFFKQDIVGRRSFV